MPASLEYFRNAIVTISLAVLPALYVDGNPSIAVHSLVVNGTTQPASSTIKIVCSFVTSATPPPQMLIYKSNTSVFVADSIGYLSLCQIVCAPETLPDGYRFSASWSSGVRQMTTEITYLQRTSDEKFWTCKVNNLQAQVKLIVATEPTGVVIPSVSPCDLANSSCQVECKTNSCTYPAPTFYWFYTADNGNAEYNMFGAFNPIPTEKNGPCTFPEMIYGSKYTLPIHTSFPDNTPKTIRLFCRLQFATFTDQLKSNLANDIQMAVSVSWVTVIQPESTNELSAIENESTELKCRASGSRPIATVYWYKKKGQIKHRIYDGITNETQSVGNGLLETISTLMLQFTRREHGWNVTCSADNFGDNEIYANNPKILNIMYSATVMNLTAGLFGGSQSQESVTVEEYVKVSGTCKTDSNPLATIKVSQRDRIFAKAADTLELTFIIQNVTCYNNGKILCSAKNNISGTTGSEKSLQLNVKCSPRLEKEEKEANHVVVAKEGAMAVLSLTVIAFPPPDYQWHRYNKGYWEIIENDTDFALTSKDLQYILTVTNVTRNHYGEYNLTLSNEHGPPLTFVFNLQNKGRPEVPVDISVSVKSPTAITVMWTPGYDGEVKQTFHIEYKPNSANDWLGAKVADTRNDERPSVDISGLQPSTEYALRMFASNEEGNSSLSETVSFRTQDSDSPNLAGIVGGAVGGVIAVGVFIAVIIFVVRRRNSGGMKKQIIEERSNAKEEKGGEQYNPNYENPLNDSNESEVKESSKAAKRKDKQTAPTNFSHDGLQYADLTFENTGKSGKQKKPPKPTATEGVVYDDVKIGAVGEAYYSKVDIKKGAK